MNNKTIELDKLLALKERWIEESNRLYDEFLWCREHKFSFEAQLKSELRTLLRSKISQLNDIIK